MSSQEVQTATENTREVTTTSLQTKLQTILAAELTVDTIGTYADDVIDGLGDLLEEATNCYAAEVHEETTDESPDDPSKSGGDKTLLEGGELEEASCKYFDLPPVSDILDKAQQKDVMIRRAAEYMRSNMQHIDEVITPPASVPLVNTLGEGTMVVPGLKNRLQTLLYVLQDEDIDLEDVEIIDGEVTPEMFRQTSYVIVIIEELDRIVEVCDEEGNASYMFDAQILGDLGLTVSDLNAMTKPDKNRLLAEHPELGQRFVQTPDWVAKVREMLYEDLSTPQIAPKPAPGSWKEGLPQIFSGELDDWRGFALDPATGKHLGSVTALFKRLEIAKASLEEIIAKHGLAPSEAFHPDRTRKITVYPYEDILELPEIKEILARPNGEKKGEWQGFWIDPLTGYHYGTTRALAKKLNGISRGTLRDIIAESDIGSVELRGKVTGREDARIHAYPIELVGKIPRVERLMSLPAVSSDGEWKGFLAIEGAGHFGTKKVLCRRLGIEMSALNRLLELAQPRTMQVRSAQENTAYCLEDIPMSEVDKLQNAKPVEAEGQWKDFVVDEAGGPWGAINAIARRLEVDPLTVRRAIAGHSLATIAIRGRTPKGLGAVRTAYSLEDVAPLLRKKTK